MHVYRLSTLNSEFHSFSFNIHILLHLVYPPFQHFSCHFTGSICKRPIRGPIVHPRIPFYPHLSYSKTNAYSDSFKIFQHFLLHLRISARHHTVDEHRNPLSPPQFFHSLFYNITISTILITDAHKYHIFGNRSFESLTAADPSFPWQKATPSNWFSSATAASARPQSSPSTSRVGPRKTLARPSVPPS